MDIGSKGLAMDTIHNKGGYLAVGFNKSKKKRKMPQSYCLNAYAKCDLEWESKQVLEKRCQGRVPHERKYDTQNDEQPLIVRNLVGHALRSKLAH